MEAFLKWVRYPTSSMPTRSALFTPGNENTWPKLLGVLDWVVSYLNYRDKAAASPKGWHHSAPPPPLFAGHLVFWRRLWEQALCAPALASFDACGTGRGDGVATLPV